MKKYLLIVSVLFFSASCAAQSNYGGVISEKNGKIGIGTKNPDETLTVKGKIHTQEVLVDLEGAVAPDYVFEQYVDGVSALKASYKRLSIEELENYIKKNKHLPNIPSAKEMTSEGIALKAMNLLLLEKIEELTLYTIEQQKELALLKEKINALEKE